MTKAHNVFLVGAMGSGKTSVGRQLARELSMDFIDSDEEIERCTGVDIRFIFEKEGESLFREREKAIISNLTQMENLVLATGGGSILDAKNRQLLNTNGIVVYLETSVKQQLLRTQKSKTRPLLVGKNPEAVLTRLMTSRGPLYEQVAHFSVNTGKKRVAVIVNEIKKKLLEQTLKPLK
ncbi:MAG: shikimate kinase AroK [Gammaproteobacteria bacterium]|nr:shikimate kinase AroK [Gammaproteobacteria bacterium]